MTFNLTEDFKSVEELCRGPEAIVDQVRRTDRPVVITAQGKPEVVMLKAAEYERLVHTLNLARLLAEGEASIRAGKTRPAEEFFEELLSEERRADKVPRRNRSRRRA